MPRNTGEIETVIRTLEILRGMPRETLSAPQADEILAAEAVLKVFKLSKGSLSDCLKVLKAS